MLKIRETRANKLESIRQGILNGLVMGWIYVLVALGLTIVFSIMRIVQFADGEIYMLGGLLHLLDSCCFGPERFCRPPLEVGQIILAGKTHEIMNDEKVRKAFLGG